MEATVIHLAQMLQNQVKHNHFLRPPCAALFVCRPGCCTSSSFYLQPLLNKNVFPVFTRRDKQWCLLSNVVWRVTGYAWGWVTLEMGGHCLAKCKGNSGVENVSVKLPLMPSQALHTSAYWRVEVVDFTSVFSQRFSYSVLQRELRQISLVLLCLCLSHSKVY